MCIGPVWSNCHPWTGPIGRSSLFLDRSWFGSVQVHSSVGPVRLHLQNCRSCTLDRTEPRLNRCCPSLIRRPESNGTIRIAIAPMVVEILLKISPISDTKQNYVHPLRNV